METTIKAYIAILTIGYCCYFIWQRAVRKLALIFGGFNDNRRINKIYFISWVIITSVAFLSFNYYIFSVVVLVFIYLRLKIAPAFSRGGLYVFLLLGLPSVGFTLPGFLGINQLFYISWGTIIGFSFLLFFQSNLNEKPRKKNIIDVLIFLLWILVSVLSFRDTTATNGLRETFIYFNLIVVPYLVGRKTVVKPDQLQWVFYGFVFVILIISGIGVFESLKKWVLYESLSNALGLPESTITAYKYRSGFLRISSTLGSINLAGVCGCALVIFYYLTSDAKKNNFHWLIFGIIIYALFATHSRAPWLISAAMMLFYVAKNKGFKGMVKLGVYGFFLGILLLVGGAFDSVISGFMLKDSYNVDYRERLLELGIAEIMKNPLTGNLNFYNSPDLQVLIQGEGIIDIVNTFLQIGLRFGLIAVGLFTCLVVLWPLYLYKNNNDYQKTLVYLIVMMGLVALLFTVSSFSPGNMFPLLMFLVGAGHALRKD